MCFSDESRAKASLVGLGASSEHTADTANEKSPVGQHGKRFTGQRARFPPLGPRISQAERNRGLNTRGQIRYQRWAAVTVPHFPAARSKTGLHLSKTVALALVCVRASRQQCRLRSALDEPPHNAQQPWSDAHSLAHSLSGSMHRTNRFHHQ